MTLQPHNLFIDAESYSKNSTLQYQATELFLQQYEIQGNESVLDIGCGYGNWTYHFACQTQGSVIGVDASSEMITLAKQKHQRDNLYFEVMNAEDISFPEKFDLIMSSFCLQWVKNKLTAFQKIAHHLKDTGQAMLIMPFPNEDLADIRAQLMRSDKWSSYFINFSDPSKILFDNDYGDYAKRAGFKNISLNHEKVTTKFNTKDELKGLIRNIMPLLHKLPTDDLKNNCVEDVMSEYLLRHPIAPDGSCEITFTYAQLMAKGIK